MEAQRELDRLSSVLRQTLEVNDAIDWDQLKDKSNFLEPRPPKPQPRSKPREPRPDDPEYQPKFRLLDKLMTSRRERIITNCRAKFEADCEQWKREAQAIDATNTAAEEKYQANLREWEKQRSAFLEKQRLNNEAVDKQRAAYMAGSAEAVTEYCDMVLSASDYPDYFPQEFSLDYNPETKILVVDYALPAPEDIPTVREVKFVPSRDEFVEQHLSQGQVSKLYDDLLYQRTPGRYGHAEAVVGSEAYEAPGRAFGGLAVGVVTSNPKMRRNL